MADAKWDHGITVQVRISVLWPIACCARHHSVRPAGGTPWNLTPCAHAWAERRGPRKRRHGADAEHHGRARVGCGAPHGRVSGGQPGRAPSAAPRWCMCGSRVSPARLPFASSNLAPAPVPRPGQSTGPGSPEPATSSHLGVRTACVCCTCVCSTSCAGLKIIELGAGCGWLGLTIARNLPSASVCITEMEEGGALEHLEYNVALNPMDNVSTAACDWALWQARARVRRQPAMQAVPGALAKLCARISPV